MSKIKLIVENFLSFLSENEPPLKKKSNPVQPNVREKTNKLKTLNVNPILQLSEDIFKKKLGSKNDGSGTFFIFH